MAYFGYIFTVNRMKRAFILLFIAIATFFVFSLYSVDVSAGCGFGPTVSCAGNNFGGVSTINGFAGQGKLRIWSTSEGSQRVEIKKNGALYQNVYPSGAGIIATIDVIASDTITLHSFDCYGGNCSYLDAGWKPENTGAYANTCGTGCDCGPKEKDGQYAIVSTSGFRSMVQNGDNGNPIGQLQCWGDWPESSWDNDFNDFMMWYTFESTCTCTPVSCPPGGTMTKFMTYPVSQGTGVACNNCVLTTTNCQPLYRNTAPTCSLAPATISMTREDSPKTFSFTVSDNDYGDTVTVNSVKIVDTAGNLKSCATVKTLGGGSIIGSTVRAGTDNPAAISQTTQFLIDARESHGLFGNVGGRSLCSGRLEIEISDLDSDGSGPDIATTPSVKCIVNVEVENQAPQLTNVSLYDRDQLDTVRDRGAIGDGNLIDGRSKLFVGSPLTTQSKMRASYCGESLSLLDPIVCPGGAEKYETAMSRRRNPLQLEFTVRDANGIEDIMQAGVWIQRESQNNSSIALPTTQSGVRNSMQAMYSEKENMQIASGSTTWSFVSRACLGQNCGPNSLNTSSKLQFTGLSFINALGSVQPVNGNVRQGTMQWASQALWQAKGFPACLNTPTGCTSSNLPLAATTAATADQSLLANYDWAVATDDSHMLCFPSNNAVPTVVPVSTPVSVCPTSCAACLKKEGISTVPTDANALTFKFGVYLNDQDGGQGMEEESYAIFLSALDKVSVPLNNVTGKGDEGWARFNKSGILCAGTSCGTGMDYSLVYDPIAPTVTYISWTTTGLSGANATFTVSDNTNGSGIKGVSNRFMVRQEELEGEALGDRFWANKVSDGQPFDGKNDFATTTNPSQVLSGTGLTSGDAIIAGLCVYDNAGNMACGRNGSNYTFLGPWLKTSYGDIYSNKGGTVPFSQTIPTDNGTTNDNTKSIYEPFGEQVFTALTGYFMTAASTTQGTGINGGHLVGGLNMQLGFRNYYRSGTSSYDFFGHYPFLTGNEYNRLRSTAILNCDRINIDSAGSCQNGGSLSTIGQARYNILYATGGTITNLVCTNTNVIFVTGALLVNGQVSKATTGTHNGCIFILADGASLTIDDIPSDSPRPPAGDGKGSPIVDKFDAAVIAGSGATFTVNKGARGATTKSTDRLEIRGWVYMADTTPVFKRNLAPIDNRRYPSEWIIYDATLLDLFRDLLGVEKTVDLTCGTSTHALCQSQN